MARRAAAMVTPMFPLQSVLLPGAPLPLQVFEPRYLAMLDTVVGGDRQFGVVLIERGREVGGGDVRCDVATMARVAEVRRLHEGRLFVMAVGDRRIRVRRWLADDPYPRAETEDWPDEPDEAPPESGRLLAELAALVSETRTLVSRLEFGPAPEPPAARALPADIGDDPAEAAYRAAALAPLGPLDRYEVLRTPGAHQRLVLAHRLVADAVSMLRAQIELGAR